MHAVLLVFLAVLHTGIGCYYYFSEVCSQCAYWTDRSLWRVCVTDYIKRGNITEGQEAAKVELLLRIMYPPPSYAAHFRFRHDGRHCLLFFWYFPAEEEIDREAPVIFWVQGASDTSLVGLFHEHGPLDLVQDYKTGYRYRNYLSLIKREFNWSKHNHVVYLEVIDSLGFNKKVCGPRANNLESICSNMHEMVVQFFQLFPDLSSSDVYFAGEGYASKIILCAAQRFLVPSTTGSTIRLKGVALASPAVDPGFMVYGQHLAQLGLIGMDTLPDILDIEKQFVGAYKTIGVVPEYTEETFRTPVERHVYTYYYSDPTINLHYLPEGIFPENVIQTELTVRGALKTNVDFSDIFRSNLKNYFQDRDLIFPNLNMGEPSRASFKAEVTNSLFHNRINNSIWYSDVSPVLEEVLEHCRVLLYNGQLDILFNYPNTQDFARRLEWSGSSLYRSAERKPWYVDRDFAGFARTGGNLTVAVLMGAGQMVSMDQPAFAYDLINKFVRDQPLQTRANRDYT